MNKKDVMQSLGAVCRTLDGGITVSGVQNAGNLAGCFSILQDVIAYLNDCDIVPVDKKEK